MPSVQARAVSSSRATTPRFSTKTGSLRFILSKGERTETLWIQNAARKKLLQVKVEENLPLIYTELGVYAGQRLGTPCDDL